MEVDDCQMCVCPDGYIWEFDSDGYPTLKPKSNEREIKNYPDRESYYIQPCEHSLHKKLALEWLADAKLKCPC